MNTLFNTQDNQEFLGIRSDASLNKANKKGTPQYEEWLRKYREKRGAKPKSEDAAKEKAAAKEVLESSDKAEKFISAKDIKGELSSFKGERTEYFSDGVSMGEMTNFEGKIKDHDVIISFNNDTFNYIKEYGAEGISSPIAKYKIGVGEWKRIDDQELIDMLAKKSDKLELIEYHTSTAYHNPDYND